MKINFDLIRKILRMTYNMLLAVMMIDFACFLWRRNVMNPLHILLLVSSFILSYIIRDFIMNNFLILIFHGLIGVAEYFIVGDAFIRWLLILGVVLLYIESTIYVMFHGKIRPLTDMPWPTFLAGLIMYCAGLYMKNPDMVRMAYIMPIILFVLYLIMMYAEGVTGYVKSTKDVEGLPLKRILSTNSMIILGILLVTALSITLSDFLHFDEAFVSFGQSLLKIVRLIALLIGLFFKLISRLMTTGRGGITEEEKAPVRDLATYNNTVASGLEFFLKLAVMVLAAFVVFKIIQKLIRFFLVRHTMESDMVENVSKEERRNTREKINILELLQEKLSYAERARKIYRTKILMYRNYYVPDERKTVEDIKQDVENQAGEDISSLSELYEVVRYGNEPVTKEMLKKMKSLPS